MIKYGVSKAGFIKKPYNQIEADLVDKAKNTFGDDVDLSVYSPIGLFVRMLSWNSHLFWQELEDIYYSNWLQTAEGVSLDRLVSLGGLTREPAKHAVIRDVKFTGTEGTLIPEGFEIQTKEEVRYRTMSSGVITGTKIFCDIVAGSKRISIAQEHLANLSEKIMVIGTGIPEDTQVEEIDPARSEVILTKPVDSGGNDIEINFDPKALIHCRAFESGPGGAVATNSLTEIMTPIPGLDAVNNENPSAGALDIETDAALRKRYETEGVENRGSSVDAIRSALSKVEDIISAVVYENTSLHEVEGMPPKSVECMVQGARDKDIAQAIFLTKSAGILTCGNTMCEITYDNKKYEIYFTRPDIVDITISIDLAVNDEWENRKEDIKTNIIEYIGGTDTRGGKTKPYPRLDPGSTIYPWRIKAVNKDVRGIESFNAVRINNSLSKFKLDRKEIPNIDNSKITINVP